MIPAEGVPPLAANSSGEASLTKGCLSARRGLRVTAHLQFTVRTSRTNDHAQVGSIYRGSRSVFERAVTPVDRYIQVVNNTNSPSSGVEG